MDGDMATIATMDADVAATLDANVAATVDDNTVATIAGPFCYGLSPCYPKDNHFSPCISKLKHILRESQNIFRVNISGYIVSKKSQITTRSTS
jgi:hypothetical protein